MSSSRSLALLLLFLLVLIVTPTTTFADDGKHPDPTPASTAPQVPALTGGPDAYGYTFIDRNSPGGPNSDGIRFTNIATTGTPIVPSPTRDDGIATVPIGFGFRFYGTTYTNVLMCTNGYLTFTTTTVCDPIPHDNSGEPSAYIAGWWEDLDGRCSGSSFNYQLVGSSPTRRLIVQWTNVGHYNNQCAAAQLSTFQIVLHETSNIIEVLHNGTVGLSLTPEPHYVEMGQTATTPLTAYVAPTAPGNNWGVMFLPPPQNTSAAPWQCNTPRVAIPDAPAGGISNDIILSGPAGSDVSDLNVFLQIPHTFLGDLNVTLTHIDTNTVTTMTLLPRVCGSSHNIGSLFIDDEAAGTPVCYAAPAIGTTGTARPGQNLSVFDGHRWRGTWRLTVSDLASSDVGTLMSWCLNPTLVPTAVTLVSFEGRPMADHVGLTWETASETDLLGFNLYHSIDGVRPETPLNNELIASQTPGGGQGALYAYQDYTVTPNTTYTYWLEDVALDGTRTLHDPITVSMATPTVVTLSTWQVTPHFPMSVILGIALVGVIGITTYFWKTRRL